jgi:hypothetical protein
MNPPHLTFLIGDTTHVNPVEVAHKLKKHYVGIHAIGDYSFFKSLATTTSLSYNEWFLRSLKASVNHGQESKAGSTLILGCPFSDLLYNCVNDLTTTPFIREHSFTTNPQFETRFKALQHEFPQHIIECVFLIPLRCGNILPIFPSPLWPTIRLYILLSHSTYVPTYCCFQEMEANNPRPNIDKLLSQLTFWRSHVPSGLNIKMIQSIGHTTINTLINPLGWTITFNNNFMDKPLPSMFPCRQEIPCRRVTLIQGADKCLKQQYQTVYHTSNAVSQNNLPRSLPMESIVDFVLKYYPSIQQPFFTTSGTIQYNFCAKDETEWIENLTKIVMGADFSHYILRDSPFGLRINKLLQDPTLKEQSFADILQSFYKLMAEAMWCLAHMACRLNIVFDVVTVLPLYFETLSFNEISNEMGSFDNLWIQCILFMLLSSQAQVYNNVCITKIYV